VKEGVAVFVTVRRRQVSVAWASSVRVVAELSSVSVTVFLMILLSPQVAVVVYVTAVPLVAGAGKSPVLSVSPVSVAVPSVVVGFTPVKLIDAVPE